MIKTADIQAVSLPGHLKGWLIAHARQILTSLAYTGFVPRQPADKVIAAYWEASADAIHAEWGHGTDDFKVVSDILARYSPTKLLDVGCGSGRLFGLYQTCGITDITGTDISARALELTREAFPHAKLRQVRVEDFDYPARTFDLAICNRVLQHIPPSSIALAIQKLCLVCRYVYVNEQTPSDMMPEAFFMRKYDYPHLFEAQKFACLETGRLGNQTYFVFGPGQNQPAAAVTAVDRTPESRRSAQ